MNVGDIPFITEEGVQNPLSGTGIELQSLGVIRDIGETGTIATSDIIGLIGGGAFGFYIAKRWPHSIIKWIGVIVGAELGIVLTRIIKSKMIERRIGAK